MEQLRLSDQSLKRKKLRHAPDHTMAARYHLAALPARRAASDSIRAPETSQPTKKPAAKGAPYERMLGVPVGWLFCSAPNQTTTGSATGHLIRSYNGLDLHLERRKRTNQGANQGKNGERNGSKKLLLSFLLNLKFQINESVCFLRSASRSLPSSSSSSS